MKHKMMGWQRHQLDHMQIICTSLPTDNHASTLSLIFYREDALPDAQPTVSKHWIWDIHKEKNTMVVCVAFLLSDVIIPTSI